MQHVGLSQRKINVPLSQLLDVRYGSTGDFDGAADAASILVDELANGPADGVVEAADPTGCDRDRPLLPRRADLLHRADLTAKLMERGCTHFRNAETGYLDLAPEVLETAAALLPAGGEFPAERVAEALQRKVLHYDKSGEEHYNLISALHKSVRGSDADGALYWLARMLDGGEDPMYIARRLVRMACEDIGNADPRALEFFPIRPIRMKQAIQAALKGADHAEAS